MDSTNGSGIKALDTSLDVLETVAALDGAGVSEIARRLDRSKGGVYKHVQTLTERGYLLKDGTTYRLGLRYWTHGTAVRDRLTPERVRSVVDDLAASVGHTVMLVIYEGATAAVLYCKRPAETAAQPLVEGDTVPLHATAAGKAILAYLPDDERESIIGAELAAYTDTTRTDPDVLDDALAEIHDRRLAREHGEYAEHVEAIAAPIIDAGGYPRGSIAVTSEGEALLDDDSDADESLVVSASKSLENALTD